MFLRFSTKESATHAIVAVHNTDINGQIVKCSWGKESGDPNNAPVAGQVTKFLFLFTAQSTKCFDEYLTFKTIAAFEFSHPMHFFHTKK